MTPEQIERLDTGDILCYQFRKRSTDMKAYMVVCEAPYIHNAHMYIKLLCVMDEDESDDNWNGVDFIFSLSAQILLDSTKI